MKIRHYLGMITLSLAALNPVSAQNGVSMEVLGQMTGTLDGKDREWVTISGKIDGEQTSSAHWKRVTYSMPDFSESMGDMSEFLTPEQRAQLDMLKDMDMKNHPMGAMLGQMMGQQTGQSESVQVTVSGHDPSSPNIMMAHALVLTVHVESIAAVKGKTVPADLNYIAEISEQGRPMVLYVSSDGVGEANVMFEQLEIKPDGGHAKGRFQGSMCRLDMRQMMDGPDSSDCIDAQGTFDTALAEDKSESR